MKKIIIIIAITFSSIAGFSQQKKLKNGNYTANSKTEKINLIIEDGKFYISAFSGEYEIKKDSIFLRDLKTKNLGLSLKNLLKNDKIKSDKIQFTLNDYRDYIYYLHIGTQNGDEQPKYKSLALILEELVANGFQTGENNDLVFEIDKSEFIFLAAEDTYNEKASICKFKLPENINDVTIEYIKYNFDDANISGIINEKDNEVTLSNSAQNPLVFKLNKDIEKINNLLPLQTAIKKKWTYPGKTSYFDVEETKPIDTEAVAVSQAIENDKYVFKHKILNSFKNALNNLKKTPNKFLVVSFDLKNKNAKLNFDDFIKQSELRLNDNMYGKYYERIDQFDFYLATEKDKKMLSKYNIKSDSEILFFNTTGDLLYHAPENLSVNETLFGTYDSAYKELVKANQQVEFDKVMLNKKATNKEILAMLGKVPLFEFQALVTEVAAMEDVKFVTPTVVNDDYPNDEQREIARKAGEKAATDYFSGNDDPEAAKKLFDETKAAINAAGQKTMTDEERKTLSEAIPPPASIEEVKEVVAEAATYNDYDYYSIIKNKKDLYRLKSTLKNINEKWEKIVNEYVKTNKIDDKYISVLKQELNDEGFSKKIFGRSSTYKLDFKMLDFVFANYKKLQEEKKPIIDAATGNEIVHDAAKAIEAAATMATDAIISVDAESITEEYNPSINSVLDNYFARVSTDVYYQSDIKINENIFTYYKKYLKIIDYKPSVVKKYIAILAFRQNDPAMKKEYLEIFEIYFNKIMAPNKSIIENLDLDFSSSDNGYWVTYKSEFADSCNNVAWEIVKIGTDKNWIQKAIKWSETSVEIEKNSHYYWDTLARLYYLNGQKEKGIATQQKSVDLIGDAENGEEYREVLEQMKNGTYTLPRKEE